MQINSYNYGNSLTNCDIQIDSVQFVMWTSDDGTETQSGAEHPIRRYERFRSVPRRVPGRFELRESPAPYKDILGYENAAIRLQNEYF